MRRNWIKLYVDQCLRGTMMDEMKDPGERFLWFAFLLLAGDSPYEGKIALTEDMGYSDEQLGSMLKCDSMLIKRAKRVMVKYDKIRILKNNIIQIVNWEKYQSEYQRQKPYRSIDGQKLLRKVTTEGDLQKEKEMEIRIEGDRDRDLEEDKKILTLLSKVKNYPFNKEKDLEFIQGLKVEFPDVDVLEKIKQITINWLKFPLLKKSRPRVQIRRWVTNEQRWQKEGDASRGVGKSYTKEEEFLPMEVLNKAYKIIQDGSGDISVFYNHAKSAFPKIKLQWEKSDKKPETFIKLVEGAK